MVKRAILLSLLAVSSAATTSAEEITQTQQIRIAMGVAALAPERCRGYRTNARFDQMMTAVGLAGKSSKTPFTPQEYLDKARSDASSFLKQRKKELCDAAAAFAGPTGLLDRVSN